MVDMQTPTIHFNSDNAWHDAMKSISDNREVLLTIAGVFIFLPALAATLLLKDTLDAFAQQAHNIPIQAGSDPAAMMHPLMALYAKILPWMLLIALVGATGKAAMMALLNHHHRPTVGEALRWALRCLPTLIAIWLLTSLVAGVVFGIVAALGAALSVLLKLGSALMFLLLIAMIVTIVIMVIRLSMILPIVVIEGERNPIRAMARSWNETTGNTGRLLGFYVLLAIGAMVLVLVINVAVMGIATFALGIGHSAIILSGLLSAATTMIIAIIAIAVIAAVHNQLLPESNVGNDHR